MPNNGSREKVQIACLGASTVYGVGSTFGGWPERLKRDLHQKMYGPGGLGEIYEIYNFGVPSATLERQQQRIPDELRSIHKIGRRLITLFQGGSNNAIAVDTPDNFTMTPEVYGQQIAKFLKLLQELSDDVICIGMMPMNQAKVMPLTKDNEKQAKVYFPNDRIRLFESVFHAAAQVQDITFIPLFDAATRIGWEENYQYQDGIHPNDQGHDWLYQQIKPELEKLIAA